jgi:hypothetical protein
MVQPRQRRGAGRAFDEHRQEQQDEGGGSSQNEMLFMRGNAMSGAPIMIGTNPVGEAADQAGMTMKKIMIRPCAVVNTLYMCLPASMAASPSTP